jgi:hypothetical protein
VVECDLAKVEVAGSNPVSRSNVRFVAQMRNHLAHRIYQQDVARFKEKGLKAEAQTLGIQTQRQFLTLLYAAIAPHSHHINDLALLVLHQPSHCGGLCI